jgi:hypothetical protein
MRDSNPHGQNPAVFKTAALPIRTNPPCGLFLKFGSGIFVKLILNLRQMIYSLMPAILLIQKRWAAILGILINRLLYLDVGNGGAEYIAFIDQEFFPAFKFRSLLPICIRIRTVCAFDQKFTDSDAIRRFAD